MEMIASTEPLATPAELVCPKCKMFGCHCDGPATGPLPLQSICPACRRAHIRCICASHVPYEPARGDDRDDELEERPAKRMTGQEMVEAAVREVMHCYYRTRDAARIERIVRDLATKAYIR